MMESPDAYVAPKLEVLDAAVVTAADEEEEAIIDVVVVEAEDEA